jgi:prefoldin alpha subunit
MENHDDSGNELIIKLGMFEQQINQLQQQIEAIEKSMIDMQLLEAGMDEFKGGEGKEILAQIGKNMFLKTKLASEDIIVDIGGGNFVKKSIDDTKHLIGEQVKKLENMRNELDVVLENISNEMSRMISDARGRED